MASTYMYGCHVWLYALAGRKERSIDRQRPGAAACRPDPTALSRSVASRPIERGKIFLVKLRVRASRSVYYVT